jgi:hypothetical protein
LEVVLLVGLLEGLLGELVKAAFIPEVTTLLPCCTKLPLLNWNMIAAAPIVPKNIAATLAKSLMRYQLSYFAATDLVEIWLQTLVL